MMKNQLPPLYLLRMFKAFCKPEYHADIEGDLLEFYERQSNEAGRRKANWLLFINICRLFRPGLIRSFTFSEPPNTTAMLRHNILIAFRNFLRYKMSFIVNMTGLSTGLACVIMISLWVIDESQMDKFHEKADRLYQVAENVVQGDNHMITRISTAGPTAETLVAEVPEVEMAVTCTVDWVQTATLTFNETNVRAEGTVASPSFFQMFSFPLLQGDSRQVLRDKQAIVISESLAKRLFGTKDDVVGKTIEENHKEQYVITGVMADIHENSSLRFDYVTTFEHFLVENDWALSWFNTAPQTFVLLKDGKDGEAVSKKIENLIRTKTEGKANHRSPFVRQFSESYLYNRYENGRLAGGRIEYVTLFSIIAGFILLIACINFMNLSTARASRRIKEIGVKKVVGAKKGTLIAQYLSESVLLAFISLAIALLIVLLLLPQFNVITGKQLTLVPDSTMLLSLLCLVMLTGIIAGSYPALYLSKFNPAMVLKGKSEAFMGQAWARKGLVVFQFTLSIVLIVSVMVVYKQIQYIQTKNLGYSKDNVLLMRREGELRSKLDTFLDEVTKIPGVLASSSTGHDMTGHNGGTYGINWPGKDPEDRTEFERLSVNFGFTELLGMEIKEGRTFSRNSGNEGDKIIFNEAAIAYMGFKDPIGKKINFGDDEMEIIGVVKDFHYETFHEKIKPAFLYLNSKAGGTIMIKLEAGKERDAITALEKFTNTFNPGFPFEYRFIDDDYQKLYASESRVATLSKYFAVLAVLISCLGLFGLAAFTAERRVKEIGIRKVLGSGEGSIVFLLTREFTVMVIAAIVIALPVSWFFADMWLKSFVFHIELEWWFFVMSGSLALFIAWLTVAVQTFKAARLNPAACLKSE